MLLSLERIGCGADSAMKQSPISAKPPIDGLHHRKCNEGTEEIAWSLISSWDVELGIFTWMRSALKDDAAGGTAMGLETAFAPAPRNRKLSSHPPIQLPWVPPQEHLLSHAKSHLSVIDLQPSRSPGGPGQSLLGAVSQRLSPSQPLLCAPA